MTSSVTVVVTGHAEGPLLHPTLRSVRAARDRAEADGVEVDIVLVLDAADEPTRRYAEGQAADCRVVAGDFRDPARARNVGASHASGDLIALLDGDDMFGTQWLARAVVEAATMGADRFVLHPECVVCFGTETLIAYPVDSRSRRFRPKSLVRGNLWNSVHVVLPRQLLLDVPFYESEANSGLGYEDWHWHAELVACGVEHRVVPQTAVFYRRKTEGSRFAGHTRQRSLLPPSSLLCPTRFPFLAESAVWA